MDKDSAVLSGIAKSDFQTLYILLSGDYKILINLDFEHRLKAHERRYYDRIKG